LLFEQRSSKFRRRRRLFLQQAADRATSGSGREARLVQVTVLRGSRPPAKLALFLSKWGIKEKAMSISGLLGSSCAERAEGWNLC